MTELFHLPVPRRRPQAPLVVDPSIVAHRGASGVRPEHTLAAYRTAIRMGADAIELDLVSTADGVLLARHDAELSATTDVARHPQFADRHTTKVVDDVTMTGWFTEDFTLAEVKQLTCRERFPRLRPGNLVHDGQEGIPTLGEVLAMVAAESIIARRPVGVLLELKHASRFAGLDLDLTGPLLRELARHGHDHPWSPVTVMSFEPTVLQDLAGRTRVPLIQLLDLGLGGPADLLNEVSGWTWDELAGPRGLDWIDEYADGIGAHKTLVLPRGARGEIGEPSELVVGAHQRGMTVHVWTLRAENRFLPTNLRVGEDPHGHGDLAAEVAALLDAGVDGLVTDHPDVVLASLAPRALATELRLPTLG